MRGNKVGMIAQNSSVYNPTLKEVQHLLLQGHTWT